MAKRIYVGVGNTTRRVKKAYVGINGIARRIKKAYIGVGGVARPCFSTELEYWGNKGGFLNQWAGSAALGDYAIFAGGYYAEQTTTRYKPQKDVVAYSKTLTQISNVKDLSEERYELSGATVGNYALFGPGSRSSWSTQGVDVYDKSLTKITDKTLTFTTASEGYAAAAVGNYALFTNRKIVEVFDSSLTHTTLSDFASGGDKSYDKGTTVGGYAIFGGGPSLPKAVDAYDSSLTHFKPADHTHGRRFYAATAIGDYAIFGGGDTFNLESNLSTALEVYDKSLVHTNSSELSVPRESLAATSVGDYAIFAGGSGQGNSDVSAVVDVYDASLVHTIGHDLSKARDGLTAATVGNYALFASGNTEGGTSTKGSTSIVDVYTA